MAYKNILLLTVLSAFVSTLPVVAMEESVSPKTFERKEANPEITVDKDFADFDISKLPNEEQLAFKEAMELLDKTIGEVAVLYVIAPDSPVLNFATKLSQRYLQLLEAYIKMQMKLGVRPMKSAVAGSIKGLALSHKEALQLADLSNTKNYMMLEQAIEDQKNQDALWKMVLENVSPSDQAEQNIVDLYNHLTEEQKDLLKKVHKYGGFRHTSHEDVADYIKQLREGKVEELSHGKQETFLTKLAPRVGDDFKSRLIMEIQQRIMSLNAKEGQTSYGGLGSNVLAMLNVVKHGEKGHPLSEFRNKMYFVYMLNDFINEIMLLPEDELNVLNSFLNQDYGWSLSKDLIDYLKNRRKDVSYIAPLFRYGAHADLNTKGLRSYKTGPSSAQPVPMDPKLFSKRERLALYGDRKPVRRAITVYSGKDAFELETNPEKIRLTNPKAAQYLEIVNKLGLPVVAGISGTLDQSVTMATLVGLINNDEDLKCIRLAYIAFMVPNHDHTVHEILESSKSFGLSYDATPLLQYAVLDEEFANKVNSLMQGHYGIDIVTYINNIRSELNLDKDKEDDGSSN